MTHDDDINPYTQGWRAGDRVRRHTQFMDEIVRCNGDVPRAFALLVQAPHDVEMHRFKQTKRDYQNLIDDLVIDHHPDWAEKVCQFAQGKCRDAHGLKVPNRDEALQRFARQ